MGPYFSKNSNKLLKIYINKVNDRNIINFLNKMKVESYDPKKCSFLNY